MGVCMEHKRAVRVSEYSGREVCWVCRLQTEIERLRAGEHTVYYTCEAGVYEGKLNQVTLDGDTDWVVPLTWCHATREAADAAGGET